MEKKNCHIMLAFVSPVNKKVFDEPVTYPDLAGESYTGVQTNEAAIVKADRLFHLDHLFFVASEKVASEMDFASEFGRVTHLDYLKKRLCKENPGLAQCISEIPYRDSHDMDETLRGVTDISQVIMSYAKEHPSENIILSVDMTGGYRYSTMMMLAAMQLLQYEGIEIGHVFYTDFNKRDVFDATSLERVFQLVSGAAEFVKFGSVESLQDYFGSSDKDLSPSLIDLLSAMQEFSDAIKICRTGLIQPTLMKLRTAIINFRDDHGQGLEETLFAGILEVIEREYGALIGDDADEISIIRWCAAKGFFQQTMTLCTEWLPLYFINHKIAYTEDTAVIEACKLQGKREKKSWQVFFITTYNPKAPDKTSSSKAMLRELFTELGEVLAGTKELEHSLCQNYPRICDFVKEYRTSDRDLELLQKHRIGDKEFSKRKPMLSALSHILYDIDSRLATYTKTYPEFVRKYNKGTILRRYNIIGRDWQLKLFDLHPQDGNSPDGKQVTLIAQQDEDMRDHAKLWKATLKRYQKLMKMGIYQSAYSEEEMLRCLHVYSELRAERNQINHANAKTMKSAKEIEKIIQHSLDVIEAVVK